MSIYSRDRPWLGPVFAIGAIVAALALGAMVAFAMSLHGGGA